ncbi:MAG: helix-hairpin-helix domain-containing protein [Gemmatimonadota bacterium]
MSRISQTDSRALAYATCLLALGTVVRIVLAPDTADVMWRPARSDRAAETLAEARSGVDAALEREAEASRPLEPDERIDINTADEPSLRRLPGIGPARAAAIRRDRGLRGSYTSADDLTRVPGIGRGIVDRLRSYIHVTPGESPRSAHRSVGMLDLNRAQINELEQITGIGPALAARIAAARDRNGRFKELDDLVGIPGIGPKTMEILRDEAYVQ